MNIATLPQEAKNFYPTPQGMIDKMIAGIEWDTIDAVLEPSAGKGDLAEAVDKKMRANRYWQRGDVKNDIDCVEIDPHLRMILSGKGLRVVHDDFLTMRTYKKYSLIAMNPPFDRGAEHLLKALEMQKNGGMVVCLLNAETIRNPYTYARQKLCDQLREYDASIEYVDNGFATAERKTNVEVAIVKCVIPQPAEKAGSILDNLRKDFAARKHDEAEHKKTNLAKGDFIDAIVDTYNFEVELAMRLFDEYKAIKPFIKRDIDPTSSLGSRPMLVLAMYDGAHHSMPDEANENKYIQEVRKKYWSELFSNPKFMANLTSNLQQELHESVEKLKDYDFSRYNIMQLNVDMSKKVIKGIEDTIMELFDDWTRKYHYDENSKNRHYFDGWCTNDAFAVNKRVVIPFRDAYDSWSGKLYLRYKASEKMRDIEKVFDYLDGKSDKDDTSVREVMDAAQKAGQTKDIQFKYFTATFYKKGTCHLTFTNLDVLKRFNLFAAQGKNWLPPSYGKKRYKDMDAKEKRVIDSFEGEKSYQDTLDRREYFLNEVKPVGLMEGTP